MREKYLQEFKEMYERYLDGESPINIVKSYHHIMDEEGIETMGLLHHFIEHVSSQSE